MDIKLISLLFKYSFWSYNVQLVNCFDAFTFLSFNYSALSAHNEGKSTGVLILKHNKTPIIQSSVVHNIFALLYALLYTLNKDLHDSNSLWCLYMLHMTISLLAGVWSDVIDFNDRNI